MTPFEALALGLLLVNMGFSMRHWHHVMGGVSALWGAALCVYSVFLSVSQ